MRVQIEEKVEPLIDEVTVTPERTALGNAAVSAGWD